MSKKLESWSKKKSSRVHIVALACSPKSPDGTSYLLRRLHWLKKSSDLPISHFLSSFAVGYLIGIISLIQKSTLIVYSKHQDETSQTLWRLHTAKFFKRRKRNKASNLTYQDNIWTIYEQLPMSQFKKKIENTSKMAHVGHFCRPIYDFI